MITDEMVENITYDGDLCDAMAAEFGYLPAPNAIRYILTAYHKILSTQEPGEELVERVCRAISEAEDTGVLDYSDLARAAIKEAWRVG